MTKKIEAIILPEQLNDVESALHRIGVIGMHVAEIRGRGRRVGIELSGRNGIEPADWLPRLLLRIVQRDDNVGKTVETIRAAASTGDIGDGLIFVSPVEDVIRVRTGERSRGALPLTDELDEQRETLGEAVSAKPAASPLMDDVLAFTE